MKKALITGANKSIGFETARQLLQKGYYVYLGSRNIENGLKAVDKLEAEGLNNVEAIQIDVSNDESVKAAVIGRAGETATFLSRCLFNSELRGFGFAPRHLSR